MTYPEAANYLLERPRFAVEGSAAYAPGLQRIEGVLEAMGRPQAACPLVHIAGTNGKGSTASFLAAIFTAYGKRTGLHTSPHLHHLAERLRIDGQPAPETWIASRIAKYNAVFSLYHVSFFEAMVALSLLYFAEEGAEVAVVEVGLGGRLDATNIVSPELAIITSIGLDHTQILGNSIRDIAREKAGIIKDGIPVFTGVTQPDASAEIQQIAAQRAAPVYAIEDVVTWAPVQDSLDGTRINAITNEDQYSDLQLGLRGEHQARNALLALMATEYMLPAGSRRHAAITRGLAETALLSGLRGRMEVVNKEPLVVLDVGHNAEGLAAALKHMSNAVIENEGQLFVMFGTMRDKDTVQMAKQLAAIGAFVFTPPIHSDRALPPTELAQILRSHDIACTCVESVEKGLSRFYEVATSKDGLLIVGSHFLVAQYN
ncbi:MAG: Mur ligase family protein [Bacteroidota bacterium]